MGCKNAGIKLHRNVIIGKLLIYDTYLYKWQKKKYVMTIFTFLE